MYPNLDSWRGTLKIRVQIALQNLKRESESTRDYLVVETLTRFVRGRRVTAFGVLFNFTGNDKNTTVQQVSDMVNEKWVRFSDFEGTLALRI